MSAQTISLRIPDGWLGRFSSADVRGWVGDFLQRPSPDIPADPGGGEGRVTLSLPKRAVKVVSGLLDCSESAALRRIIAANIGGLPAGRPVRALPSSSRAEWMRPALESGGFDSPRPEPVPSCPLASDLEYSLALGCWTRRADSPMVPAVVQARGWLGEFWSELPLEARSGLCMILGLAIVAVFRSVAKPVLSGGASAARELPRFADWVPRG